MQFWQAMAFIDTDELLELVPVAEEAGFEGIMLADHVIAPESFTSRYPYDDSGEPPFDGESPLPEVWSTISALSMVTKTLRFMTNVYILPLRHPIEVAKGLSTAAAISKNRVVFGLGAGWLREEFEILERPFAKRGKRMDEQLEIIQRLLSGEIVEFKGEFYEFPPLQMRPLPTEPVPMWIGGMNKAALRRAGQFGSGWTGAGTTFDQTIELLTEIRAQRERFGRQDESFDCLVPLVEEYPPEKMERLFELGMTGTVCWPLNFTLPPGSSIQDKKDALRRFGDEVIRPTNG